LLGLPWDHNSTRRPSFAWMIGKSIDRINSHEHRIRDASGAHGEKPKKNDAFLKHEKIILFCWFSARDWPGRLAMRI